MVVVCFSQQLAVYPQIPNSRDIRGPIAFCLFQSVSISLHLVEHKHNHTAYCRLLYFSVAIATQHLAMSVSQLVSYQYTKL